MTMQRGDTGNEGGHSLLRGGAAWGLAAAVAVACFASQAFAAVDHSLPGQTTRDHASVGGMLFNRPAVTVRDARHLVHIVRHLAEDTGFRPTQALVTDAASSDAPPIWRETRPEELIAMDPLTVSVVSVPPPFATGLLLLGVLLAGHLARRFTSSASR
jgi:hypothetical protein